MFLGRRTLALVINLLLTMTIVSSPAPAEEARLVVDLRDPGARRVDPADVEVVRLNQDGSLGDRYEGRDIVIPYGTYRIQVFIASLLVQSTTIAVVQSEVHVQLGVSLLNCCIEIPGGSKTSLGEIDGVLIGFERPSAISVHLLPVWSNAFHIAVRPSEDGRFKFYPIDLGQYIVVLSRDGEILRTRPVNVTEFGPKQSVEFRISP